MIRPRFIAAAALLVAGCQSHSLPALQEIDFTAPQMPATSVTNGALPKLGKLPSAPDLSSIEDPNLVRLPPLKVERREVEYRVSYSEETHRAQEVVINWVSPTRYKMGFRIGDRLVSIDGRPVSDVPAAELRHILEDALRPGESHPVSFTGVRRQGLSQVTIAYAGGIWEPDSPAPAARSPRPPSTTTDRAVSSRE